MTGAPWQYQDPSKAPAQPNQPPSQESDTALPDASAGFDDGAAQGGPYGGPSTDKKQDAIWNRLRLRFFTQAGNGIAIPITPAATTVTLTLQRAEQNTDYGVHVETNWLTTSMVSAKSTTQFTVTFGTAAPGSATLDYITFRAET